MPFEAKKNLTPDDIAAMVKASTQEAVRRIHDPHSGDYWYWPAEMATHAEGAEKLGIPYDKRPGEGDIITI